MDYEIETLKLNANTVMLREQEYQKYIKDVLSSTSWRLTAPMRKIVHKILHLKKYILLLLNRNKAPLPEESAEAIECQQTMPESLLGSRTKAIYSELKDAIEKNQKEVC